MHNAPMNFLFEEFTRLLKPMLYVFSALSVLVTLNYIQKPNLFKITTTIKELSYVSENASPLGGGGAASLLQTFAGSDKESENLETIRDFMISKFVAERLLEDQDPALQGFLAEFKDKKPGFIRRLVASLLNVQYAPADTAQRLADYLKSAMKFELKKGVLSIELSGVERDVGYALLNKVLFTADALHRENSLHLMEFAQNELNGVFERTQDVNVRRFVMSQIYNKAVSSISLKPEPPYFYTVIYPPAHEPLKSVKGYLLVELVVFALVISGFGFYVLFIKPYLADKQLPESHVAPPPPRLVA